jgi:flagellar assembly protein FliH
LIRRISDKELIVETVTWPRREPGAGPLAAPARGSDQAALKASGGKPPAGTPPAGKAANQTEVTVSESAEFEKRIAELERLRQLEKAEAHHRGVEDGLRRGREEASNEVKKAFEQIAQALEELAKIKRTLRGEAEQEMVKLSLAVARRILYRELSTDPGSIEGIVHAALQKLQQREVTKVRVWPAAVPAVRAALERIGSRAGLDIAADPGLATGAILFETSMGDLDASIETQLMEIQRGFADRLAIR